MKFSFNGILNIHKPAGVTSAHVVARVKRLLPRGTKIGHAGTLDPFATGVLLLLIGKSTRRCEELMGQPKQYEAVMKFGATTETDDPESPEIPYPNAHPVSREQITQILPSFTGNIQQRPPVYSALKIAGKRACDRIRAGETVAIKPRTVRIDALELIDFSWPHLKLRIDCGRGTYIRSLARDIGESLAVGGYLTQLVRTRVGDFWLKDAIVVDQLAPETIESSLR